MFPPPQSLISHPALSKLPVNRRIPLSAEELAEFGYQLVKTQISSGFPATIQLADGYSLILTVPTGSLRLWNTAKDALLHTPATLPDPVNPGAAIPVLLLKKGSSLLGSAPLTAHHCISFTSGACGHRDVPAYVMDIIPIDWQLSTADMRGPNDSRSFLSIAWRRSDRGSAQFETSPVPRIIQARAGLAYVGPDTVSRLTPKPSGYYPYMP